MPSAASPQEIIENPWLRSFLSEPWEEIVVAQIRIRRDGTSFQLQHIDGGGKEIRLADVRSLSNFNSIGEFRPLKSTPDLSSGWILRLNSPQELELAIQYFYPNAIADWFAVRNGVQPTDYRTFTNRQTGMYRITAMLDDPGVVRVIDRVCNSICLKSRLWSSGAVPSDPLNSKSIIPCLEPCAIFLETARKEVRALQEKSASADKAESSNEPA
jgi:hypothetical protein